MNRTINAGSSTALPKEVIDEIASKRGDGAEDTLDNEQPKADETPKPKEDTETKPTKAKPSTKPSGQSIAQVASQDDTEDGDGKGGKGTDGEPKKPTVTPQERVILDLKSENRELKKMIKDEVIPTMREMQQQIKQGSLSKQDVKDELDALAEKYELDPEFVKELAGAIKTKTTKEVEDKYLTDIKDIKADREQGKKLSQEARIKQAVVSEFDRVIADNPGYSKIAKKEVITKMILNNPEYQDMAMEDVLAEVYGEIENPGMDGYTPQGSNHTPETKPSELADKPNLKGEELNSYADDLIQRMQAKSRHSK